MHIDRYERLWLIIVSGTLSVFLAALVVGAVVFGVRLPDQADTINPLFIDQSEFANPGVRHMGGNEYEVTMLAQMWQFTPNTITVPAGSRVTFNITSRDIQHGYIIEHHNVNMQIIPGHVARATVLFDRPGEYRMQCHEFCGRGHHLMHGVINVVEDTEAIASSN